MKKCDFIKKLREAITDLASQVQTKDGDWAVKGFIDVYKNIYTISSDTKVVSKIVELYIFPRILKFANDNNLNIELTKEQNYYPDITFVDKEGNLFAVDLKSTYRKDIKHVNGMTLGAFTGYFRDRKSTKNVTHPYGEYKAHIVLGIIYSAAEGVDERKIYELKDLSSIQSVVKDFSFFVQEKWRIALDRPGSGNTKNIGGVTNINDLIAGNGTFSKYSEEMFDNYWSEYLTVDMAAKNGMKPYFRNLSEFLKFKGLV